jgi:outer membrane protein assembly factor BamB
MEIAYLLSVASGFAQDWPQWRGPNRDGVVHGVKVSEKWPKALREEWRVPVGEGFSSSPVVAGGKVYIFSRQKNDEFVLCFDVQNGKEIWRTEPYPAPYQVGLGEGAADDRPRSTPAVASGRVYVLGMSGILSCLDARTGALHWRKSYKSLPYGGTSPLVADGLCIVHVGDGKTGGLTAFDAGTGEVKWCHADGSGPASGSPILVDWAGERQVVTFVTWGLIGVSAVTGKKLWSVPSTPGPNTTPVLYKDLLIAAGDRQEPLRAIRLEKGGKGLIAKEVWKANGHSLYYSSPVLAGDLLFGMSVSKSGHFFCLDANTGQTLWEGPPRLGLPQAREGNASILSAGNVLLFLTDRGRLLIVKPTATGYEPIIEYRVSDTQTWAHPVFLGDRFLIRDRTTLRSLRIESDDKRESP